MVFITAQPDEPYFAWQLTLLINNLKELSVAKRNIHILVSHDPFYGLNNRFKKLISEHKEDACFFTYPDWREQKVYQPSIRPHILKQHFARHKSLKSRAVFYLDSDVLFSRIPDINLTDRICYVSDTRKYLDSKHITNRGPQSLLEDMAGVVGLSVERIVSGDKHAGGAQYVLKGVDDRFWEKVEQNANEIYGIISRHASVAQDGGTSTAGSANPERDLAGMAWCSDMWAVLWNLWYFGREVKIDPELGFLWPSSRISNWGKKPLLHYTGGPQTKFRVFRKEDYRWFDPWFDPSLSQVSKKNCSWIVCRKIFDIRESLLAKRKKLDTCLIIYSESGKRANGSDKTALAQGMFARKYVDRVLSGSLHNDRIKLQKKDLDYLRDGKPCLGYLIIQPAGYVIDPAQYSKCLQIAKQKNMDCLAVRLSKPHVVDRLHQLRLSLSQDFEILASNKNKFYRTGDQSEILFLKNPFLSDSDRWKGFLSLKKTRKGFSVGIARIRTFFLLTNG